MNLLPKFVTYVFLAGMVLYISCKKEYSYEGSGLANKSPVADAGNDTIIFMPSSSVILDGSTSFDPDGRIFSYNWIKIYGPASFYIADVSSVKTLAENIVAGIYGFELLVTDDRRLSAKDTVQITVNDPLQSNRPPVARAGTDQNINLPGNTATLDGSASIDPDNNIAGYLWTKISGPSTFNFVDKHSVKTQVSKLSEGIYLFELAVTDSGGLSSKDTLIVNVIKNPASGQEYIFDDLVWKLEDFYGIGADDVYVGTPSHPGLFVNDPGFHYSLNFPGNVFLKLDTDTNWIPVISGSLFQPNLPLQYQYVYDIIQPSLYVHVYPLNYPLVGRKASIKVQLH